MSEYGITGRLKSEFQRVGLQYSRLAKVLGVHRSTVKKWIDTGYFPALKLAMLSSYGVDLTYVMTGRHYVEGEKKIVTHWKEHPGSYFKGAGEYVSRSVPKPVIRDDCSPLEKAATELDYLKTKLRVLQGMLLARHPNIAQMFSDIL